MICSEGSCAFSKWATIYMRSSLTTNQSKRLLPCDPLTRRPGPEPPNYIRQCVGCWHL